MNNLILNVLMHSDLLSIIYCKKKIIIINEKNSWETKAYTNVSPGDLAT